MNLIRHRPRMELAQWSALREFEDHFGRCFGEPMTAVAEREWAPAVDVTETDEAFVIEAEVPGVGKEDVTLEVLDDVVTIKGEKKSEKTEDKKGYHRAERNYGAFQRRIRIPGGFKSGEIEAKFEDGVLRVTLPKPDEARPKTIAVQSN